MARETGYATKRRAWILQYLEENQDKDICVNDIYDFYRGNLDGQGPNLWYRPSEKQLYTTDIVQAGHRRAM